MSFYVYSTLACDNAYAIFAAPSANRSLNKDMTPIERTILIKGGANVANCKTVVTPKGVVTEVSDEDMALLQNDTHFKNHVDGGYIKVEKKPVDVDKIVKTMTERDISAPVTPADFENKPGPQPVLNKGKK